MIMVVLDLALVYFAFDKFMLDSQRQASLKKQQAEQLATVDEEAHREGRAHRQIRKDHTLRYRQCVGLPERY